jgi:hypothetical protein
MVKAEIDTFFFSFFTFVDSCNGLATAAMAAMDMPIDMDDRA